MTDTGIPGEDRSVVPGAVPNAEPEQVADTNAPAGPKKDDSDPVSDAISDDARSSARGKLGWLSITVAVIFGLFYVYAFFTAIAAIVEFPRTWSMGTLDAGSAPSALPIIALLLPVVVFAAAFWIGLRRNVFGKALIFILGLAAVAALTISLNVFEASALATALAPVGV